ncbi:hypothetical protein AB0F81_49775 [Actinoplanes sp. NPDC024001]|uniref:hypothetical protein n=1 Tax=Actinoplanes sp. NPDC024001 TaxID=3154598 RepID=UPI0033FADCDF
MLFLLFMMAAMLILAIVLLCSQPDDATGAGGDGKAGTDKPDDGKAAPTTLEGALVAQLISGEITQAQYRIAVARLAKRDDERNPMTVPKDDRPESCA